MMKTLSSRRISSAIASRNASRTVSATMAVPWGISRQKSFAGSLNPAAGAGGGAVATRATGSAPLAGAGGARASSPSSAITAIGVLTATLSVPPGTRIFASVPSSTASTSIVALSVSISARTSPERTASPSFFSHFASLPCSIVGESAGMRMFVAIWCPCNGIARFFLCRLSQNAGPYLSRVRLRFARGKFRGLGDDRADRRIDLLEIVFAGLLARQQARADLFDRITLLAHFLHFVLRPVFRRIRHRMAAIAIGLHFEDHRAIACPAPFGGASGGGLHRAHIHAVDPFARNVEGLAAFGKIGQRRRPRDGRAHGVAVILDNIDDRQFPEFRHVETLVDLTLVRRAVAEISEASVAIAAITVGERQPAAERHLRPHDAMAPVKMLCLRKHVHGAALPFRGAAPPPGQFRHDGLGVHATSKHMAMIAVAGDGLVAFHRRHHDSGDDRLLTNVEMAKTADETHAIHLPRFFLEPADEEHVAKGGEFLFLAESGAVRARVLCF